MNSICIITDGTVQFTKSAFNGRQLVSVVPVRSLINGQVVSASSETKVSALPNTLDDQAQTNLIVPSVEEFREHFLDLARDYHDGIAIVHSGELSEACANAQAAAANVRGRIAVQVIDSQTISVGLGYLVQVAAETAAAGKNGVEIERLMRKILPHIYSVFCIPNLAYIYHAGFVGQSQAIVGEMLGLLPLFTLEEGHLTPIEKVRNNRQLLDFLIEFLDEFSELEQIALIQSVPGLNHEARTLREHITENYSDTPFSEHPLSLPVATLFGPRSLGLFAVETPGD